MMENMDHIEASLVTIVEKQGIIYQDFNLKIKSSPRLQVGFGERFNDIYFAGGFIFTLDLITGRLTIRRDGGTSGFSVLGLPKECPLSTSKVSNCRMNP